MNYVGVYTDVHGITHENPVIVVSDVHLNQSNTLHLAVIVSETGDLTYETRNRQVINRVYFQAQLYTNAEAFAEKKQPMQMKAPDGTQQWLLTMAEGQADISNEELVLACQNHLRTLYFTQE